MLKFSLVLSSIEISTSLDESPQSGIPRNAFRIQIPLVFVCGSDPRIRCLMRARVHARNPRRNSFSRQSVDPLGTDWGSIWGPTLGPLGLHFGPPCGAQVGAHLGFVGGDMVVGGRA